MLQVIHDGDKIGMVSAGFDQSLKDNSEHLIIHLIRDMEIDGDITEKELMEYGKVICQPEPGGDILEPGKRLA